METQLSAKQPRGGSIPPFSFDANLTSKMPIKIEAVVNLWASSSMFEFLKKYNFKTHSCSCGIVYWRLEQFLQGGCGQCNILEKKRFKETHIGLQIEEQELKNNFLNYFSKNFGYTKLKDKDQKISRANINYILAGICRYSQLYTRQIVYNNTIKKDGKLYMLNKFISAQTCIRFNDFENVGVTHRHFTNFVMLGQHIFETPYEKFSSTWMEDAFSELISFIKNYIDISLCTFHESSWTDNCDEGYSLEIFINGLEVFNQVYTTHDYVTKKELNTKYVDMGGGLKRFYNIVNKYDLKNSEDINLQVITDHLKTAYLLYDSGIYVAKRGTGHAIKRLINRAKNLDKIAFLKVLNNYDDKFKDYINEL